MNLFEFKKAGVYKIFCKQTKKIYYGQTSNFLRRSYQHLKFLEDQQHACLELQKDFNLFGIDSFQFKIIIYENSLSKRLLLEKKLIQSTLKKDLYNQKNIHNFRFKPRIAQSIQINNTIYDSIAQAARLLGKSSRTIRTYLDNPCNQNFKRLTLYNYDFDIYEVFINKKYFKSTRAVVEAGLAKTTRQVRDRCRSIKWKHWRMIKKGRTNIHKRNKVKSVNLK